MPDLQKHPHFKIGDRVQLKSRGPRWVGTITEARGTYSPDGPVRYRVLVPMEPEPLFLPVNEEEIADPRVFGHLVNRIHDLLSAPSARDRFRARCLEYLQKRAENGDRPPPMDLLSNGKSDELTLAEKYALLGALHAALHAEEKDLDPIQKPEDLSWDDFAHQQLETYKSALRWAALLDRVKEYFSPQYVEDAERWIAEVEPDLKRH